jgi:hypothetical protein
LHQRGGRAPNVHGVQPFHDGRLHGVSQLSGDYAPHARNGELLLLSFCYSFEKAFAAIATNASAIRGGRSSYGVTTGFCRPCAMLNLRFWRLNHSICPDLMSTQLYIHETTILAKGLYHEIAHHPYR